MTLKPEKVGLASRSFVWNDSTRFRANGAAVGAERVTPGQRVRVFYRREVGRLVLREVTLESNAARSPCRGCYSAAQ
jgi:hypothetical protein